MLPLLLRYMALLPARWIELLVMLQVYVLAAVYIVKELLFEATNQVHMLPLLLRYMALLPARWIELLVMLQVYVLAAVYIVKELLFEATNQGIKKRLENDIRKSRALHSARNKTVLVTGADGTIGREVVKKLLRYDFTVHALVGDRKKAKEFFASMNGSRLPLTIYEVDFGDPNEVAKFARGFVTRCTELNIVVLCAGTMLAPPKVAKFARGFVTRFTELNIVVLCAGTMLAPPKLVDNIETHMRVNVLSQALLLHLLDPILTSDSRITALSSSTARIAFFTSSLLQQGTFNQSLDETSHLTIGCLLFTFLNLV
ncbi:unnamed protein product [Strongylus vulgaris]|uniref:NAD(P)-binding domain-containing protein n=1 Tax=Strongylus vulgaris TaxID=40348 RepID=A0A3P7IWF9_STRVU|nr:unnamed protein product [Strongylus vulgaris]